MKRHPLSRCITSIVTLGISATSKCAAAYGPCALGTLRLLKHSLSLLDKLLLSPAYLAVVAYLRISGEVTAADQPEQLVDVVGSDANVARHPSHRLEHLVVTGPPGRELKGPEDVLDVRVGLGEVLVPKLLHEVARECEPESIDLLRQ
jgi:hypothetical protein